MPKPLCWTAREVLEKIHNEGGMQDALLWGIAQVPVESDEVRTLLDVAQNAARTLDSVYDRIEAIAELEEV